MAYGYLDNVSSWTPVTEELEAASSLQRMPNDSSRSLSEPTSAPIVEHSDSARVAYGQSLDKPTLIPSDIDPDVSITGDRGGAGQNNEEESDSWLPPLKIIMLRAAMLRRGNPGEEEDPVPWPEYQGPVARQASPTFGHSWRETDTEVDASIVPPSLRGCEENRMTSLGYSGHNCLNGAAIGSYRGTLGSCGFSSQPQRKGVSTEAGMPCGSKADLGEIRQGHQRAGTGVIGTDDESDSRPIKRRKLPPIQVCKQRECVRGASSHRPNAINTSAHTAARHSACGTPSPSSSRRSHTYPAGTTGARTEAWRLSNGTLNLVQLGDGRVTFQMQFDCDPNETGRAAECSNSNGTPSSTSRNVGFTSEEKELLVQLKEGKDNLTWATIHEQFSERFPGRRSLASLQVHYSRKLRGR